jgi:PAS domain S-box-containing protein
VSSPSLLSFLDAPLVVGDPEGRAAYVNPAFESRFCVSAEEVTGRPLASLFDGGVREAVLQAVAEVCEGGESARFRVRQGGVGYMGLASPIVAEDARVGFVILLLETSAAEERILALQREIQEPLGELGRVLDELVEQTGGRRSERYRTLVEEGLRALTRLRKWSGELGGLLGGRPIEPAEQDAFDPARVVGDATGRLVRDFAQAGVEFEVQVPAQLPMVLGDAARLEMALVQLLRQRLAACGSSSSVSVVARTIGQGGDASLAVAVIDVHGDRGSMEDPTEPEPELVRQIVREFGGDLRTTADPLVGRTTAIRLTTLKE